MKYTDLSDKERYEVIRLGVQNGITNLDDIEKAYNEYAEGGHVYATKGSLTKDELNTERGIIIAQINENPELLFTPGYEQWREYYRRNGQLDNMWNQIPFEKQAAIFQNNPKSITALSNKSQADFGAERTRRKTNDVAPQVLGGMATTIAAPFAVGSMAAPIAGASALGGLGMTAGEAISAAANYGLLGTLGVVDRVTQTEEEKKANANLPLGQKIANGINYVTWSPEDGIELMDLASQFGKNYVYSNRLNKLNEQTLTPQNIEAKRIAENNGRNGEYGIGTDGSVIHYPEYLVGNGENGEKFKYNYTKNGGIVAYGDNGEKYFYDKNGNQINPTISNDDIVPSFVGNTSFGQYLYEPQVYTPEERHRFDITQKLSDDNAKKIYNSMNIKPGSFNEQVSNAANEINKTRVAAHNDIAPVYNAHDKAAQERVTQTAATQNNGSVGTQLPIQVKPSNTRVRSANTTATIPVQQQTMQQQAIQQQPTRMQGFMSKLGQAAPYIGDFVGWTLGNSKFFADGGHLYDGNSMLSQQLIPKKLTDYNQGDWSNIYDRQQSANNARIKIAQAEWDKMHDEVVSHPDAYDAMDILKYAGKRPETLEDVAKTQKHIDDAETFTKVVLGMVASPFAGAAIGSTKAAGYVAPIVKSILTGTAADATSELATGKPIAEHTKDAIQFATGLNPRNNVVSNFVVDTFGNPFYGFTNETAKGFVNIKRLADTKIEIENPFKNWTLRVPKDENRYYRIVGKTGNPIGDAIESGVIRAGGANPNLESDLLIKAHDYPMFSKGKPWQGTNSMAKGDKGIIIRSKENTGPIKWEESNIDFKHKGHNGIFRPNYYGDNNAAPTQFFEYYEPRLIGYTKKEFPKSNNPYANFMGNGYFQNRGSWESNLGVAGNQFGKYIGSGGEQVVFENKLDPNSVLKVYNDTYRKNIKDVKSLVDDYINTRNNVPLQEKSEFVGLIDNKGYPYPVFKQNKLETLNDITNSLFEKEYFDKIKKELFKKGYKRMAESGDFTNGVDVITDIKPENVGILPNGDLRFIDVYKYKKSK